MPRASTLAVAVHYAVAQEVLLSWSNQAHGSLVVLGPLLSTVVVVLLAAGHYRARSHLRGGWS